MITKPNMDCKDPVGNGVYCPEYAGDGTTIIASKDAQIGSDGDINESASGMNMSAKYKGGMGHVPPEGANQYE
jgi:hypothetical protein